MLHIVAYVCFNAKYKYFISVEKFIEIEYPAYQVALSEFYRWKSLVDDSLNFFQVLELKAWYYFDSHKKIAAVSRLQILTRSNHGKLAVAQNPNAQAYRFRFSHTEIRKRETP